MNILGINAYHGDSSACLLVDGRLVAAIEEERIRRIKHWAGFPSEAIKFCLNYANLTISDIDHIAIGRNPKAQLGKKIAYSMKSRPSFSLIRDRLRNMGQILDLKDALSEALDVDPGTISASVHNVEHHRAHMASSFFLSPFEEAACLSIDGFGDFVSTMFGSGQGNELRVDNRVVFPHSLGLFYTAGTQYLGFDKYGDEFKIMGLAPYGEPEYLDELRKVVQLKPEGRFELDLDYFKHHSAGVDMHWNGGAPALSPIYSSRWEERWGEARTKSEPLEDRHRNLARSLQEITEEVYFHALNHLAELVESRNLCLAGGVAFNSVANGYVFDRTTFEELHIHPAAGDAGTAVGAALAVWHEELGKPREFELEHAYLGPAYSDTQVRKALREAGTDYEWFDDQEQIVQHTVDHIHDGEVVGWFQGRSEWGPRALGNRSILCDPRRSDMKDILNARVKRREEFRPFAPAILEDRSIDYFEQSYPVPYMQQVFKVRPERRREIPAVTHYDGTGRLQTVSRSTNPAYYRLIEVFGNRTGTPVLLNTSLNENEPIVNTPSEAISVFQRTKMDALVIGNAILRKPNQHTHG